MFSKKPQETESLDQSPVSPENLSSETVLEDDTCEDDTGIEQASEISEPQPELVNLVEKISGILSPYFIVIVGLFLYEENFLIGFVLITVGILALLKVSLKDLGELFGKITAFFNKS